MQVNGGHKHKTYPAKQVVKAFAAHNVVVTDSRQTHNPHLIVSVPKGLVPSRPPVMHYSPKSGGVPHGEVLGMARMLGIPPETINL